MDRWIDLSLRNKNMQHQTAPILTWLVDLRENKKRLNITVTNIKPRL